MGIFKKRLTVNEAINAAHTSENAIIIDCRAKEDYQKGHVAGTKNIPLDKITEDRISVSYTHLTLPTILLV